MLNKDGLIASLEERLERQKKERTPYEEKQFRLTECPSGLMEKTSTKPLFCEEFLQTHKILFTNGAFSRPKAV